jgi:hypothetical protein
MVTGAQPATKSAGAPCSAIPSVGAPVDRLTGNWQASARAALPAAGAPRNAIDIGIAPAGLRLERMLLLLEPAAAQRQALDILLEQQQTPGNCAYHQWLTGAEFAGAFANSASDGNAIAAWLTGEGFAVAPLPQGRGWIEFSGTAGLVELAFGARVHAYSTADGIRYALAGTISLPSPLRPLVRGLVSLDGALSSAELSAPQALPGTPAALAAETSITRAAALTPQLAAGLLHFDSLHSAGALGAGETIAIAARSNVRAGDIDSFRAAFGLPANPVVVTPAGKDPGLTADRAEAELAASWAGAAAPGARIVVVPAAGTAATDGIDLSLAAIVDGELAHTVVVGFSACEAEISDAHRAYYAALYRQAAAEGISVIAASGDSGAAACHAAGSNAAVTSGLAVNALASTPWNAAVGAAAFAAAGDGTLAGWSPIAPADPGYAGGGGYSVVYSAPAWQAGQSNGGRSLPDLVLPTAIDSAFSHGVAFCFGESAATGCNLVRSGGSSAAAAIFGGISALIAGQYGAQGMLAPRLYTMSAQSGMFADVAQGNALLACAAGTPGCDATGHIGYAAGEGYDLATGLGSPDAGKLFSGWPAPTPDGTTTDTVTLSVSPVQTNSTYNPSSSIVFTASVNGGSGTPTGTVNFYNDTTDPGHAHPLNSAPYGLNGSGQTSITLTSAFPDGGNNIEADYSGDTTYKAAASQVVTINIQKSTTTTTVAQPSNSPTTGIAFDVTATVAVGTPVAGTQNPTGQVTFTVDGSQVGAQSVSTNGGVTTATFSVTINSAGNHNLQAVYAGDDNYGNSTSAVTVVNVQTNTANVALAVAPAGQSAYNPSASITLTATVTAQGGGTTPTGTVNFVDQTTSATLNTNPVLLSGGIGSITFMASSGGLAANNNSIVAKYSGDTLYGTATSSASQVNVQQSTTTTTVSPATTTPTTGTAFNVTATVTVGTPPAGTQSPTGKMQLTLDGTNYASSQVTTSAGITSATFSVTVTTAGNHSLQAIYAGDTNYVTSTSTSVAVNAASNTANVSLAVTPAGQSAFNPSASITFTATVTAQGGGATPTGTVNFVDQTTNANVNTSPVQLAGGVGTITVTAATAGLAANNNSIVAKYSGDTVYGAATSAASQVSVQPSTTTTTVSPATSTPMVGTAFNVTATVTVGAPPAGTQSPTGKMTLTLDGTNYASGQVSTSGGVTSASFSVTVTTAGNHNLQAIYAGDNNYVTSTSSAVTLNATANTVTVALAVAPTQANGTYNPSTALTFTATVTPTQAGGATPTGTVNFLDQATGTDLNSSPVQLSTSGTATVSVPGGLPTGGNNIVAQYAGSGTYTAANSQPLVINIQPSSTTSTVSLSTTTPVTGVAFTVTVTVAVGTPPAGSAAPTGKVTLTLDGAPDGTAQLSTTAGVTTASFSVTLTSGGSHNLQAVYAGDANYSTSTSASVSVTASKGATVTTLTATPATPMPGTPESFTATIAASNPVAGQAANFTGSVTFFDGTTQLGTATVGSGQATLSDVTLSTATTHTITAVYSGDDNWAGSTSAALTLKAVLYPDTVTLTVTPPMAAPGQVVTLTATVTPGVAPASTAEQNPTGNIVFYNGQIILGTVALSAGPGNTSVAQLQFTTLPAGVDTIQAVYAGDLYYAAGTSNLVNITVQDFTITPAPTNEPEDLDIDKGSSGAASFIITGLGGFNSQLSVVCTVQPQDDMTCTPSPQQVTPTGTVTFTVQTYLTGGPYPGTARNLPPLWSRAAGGTALAAILFFLVPSRRRTRILRQRSRRVLMLLLLVAGLCGAGLGCSSVSGGIAGAGTPLGLTNLTITAAASIDNAVVSHSIDLTVDVLAPGSTGTAQPVIHVK